MSDLVVRDLSVAIPTPGGTVHAVTGVSFGLAGGETLGIVGESGSGKSMTAAAITGLTPPHAAVTGSITIDDTELVGPTTDWSRVRGRRVAIVHQDPMTALHPAYTVGRQIGEVVRHHTGGSRAAARRRAVELAAAVELDDPEAHVDRYPHQLSGGQRQRVLIALALASEPEILIADEPTTALDVSVQAQIARLLLELRRERDMSMIWITHDLALLAGLVDRVVVMYGGTIVEHADAGALYGSPEHPYTRALLAALPHTAARRQPLPAIGGRPTVNHAPVTSCPFAPRCRDRVEVCGDVLPPLVTVGATHEAACVHVRPAVEPDRDTAATDGSTR
ncbi:MAG: ABC transporter ATP-binding protein [Actinomycetota bacterium]|nr:ABC transporter ATP-binding protein [Actinomycetota bacterium]